MHKVLTIGIYRTNSNLTMKSNNSFCLLSFLGLSVATSPFIVSVLTLYLLMDFMTELGKASEEIFRAERLPLLSFPDFYNH